MGKFNVNFIYTCTKRCSLNKLLGKKFMNKIIFPVIGILLVGIVLGFTVNVSAQQGLLPTWIKNTAGFWASDQISDSEFINALQFMIINEIIQVPPQENPRSEMLENENRQLKLQVAALQSKLETQSSSAPESVKTPPAPESVKTPPASEVEEIGPIFTFELISCIVGEFDFTTVKGTIKNIDNEYHSPELMIYLSDSNKEVLTFVKQFSTGIAPGQKVIIERGVPSHPDAAGCGIRTVSNN